MEPARAQFALPAQVEFGRLAAQRRRPVRVGRIDGASAVAAQLAREAEQQVLGLAAVRRLAGCVDQAVPALVGDVGVDQVADVVAADLRRRPRRSLGVDLALDILVVRDQMAEVANGQLLVAAQSPALMLKRRTAGRYLRR